MRDECEGERAREICARGRSMYASKDSPSLAPEKVDFFFGDSKYEWDMHGVVDEEAKSPPEQKKKHDAGFSSDTVMPRTDTIVGAGPQIQWRRMARLARPPARTRLSDEANPPSGRLASSRGDQSVTQRYWRCPGAIAGRTGVGDHSRSTLSHTEPHRRVDDLTTQRTRTLFLWQS